MHYRLLLEGRILELIGEFDRKPGNRPHPGDEIMVKGYIDIFTITRSIPSSNPDNVQVDYILEYLSDKNIIRGGGVAMFDQYYLNEKMTGADSLYIYGRKAVH